MANEKRLIDSNALMDDVEMDGSIYACLGSVEDVRFLVDSQPTIDAAEVVHGRWIDNGIPESMLSKCSVCGFPCGAYSFNYCPNCGAKMEDSDEHLHK